MKSNKTIKEEVLKELERINNVNYNQEIVDEDIYPAIKLTLSKKDEQLKEVFREIEKLFPEDLCNSTRIAWLYQKIEELKAKYREGK